MRDSKIEWTDHTFNPWWGCTKVSEACRNCYAEAWAKRTGHLVWGYQAPRRTLSDQYWKQPLVWDKEAKTLVENVYSVHLWLMYLSGVKICLNLESVSGSLLKTLQILIGCCLRKTSFSQAPCSLG